MKTLVVVDHNNNKLEKSTLNTIKAAVQLENVDLLVLSDSCKDICSDTNVIKGITKAFEKRSSDIDLRNADPDAELEADPKVDDTDIQKIEQGINSRTAVVDTFESCSMYLPPNIVVTDNIDYNTNVPLGVFGSIVENTILDLMKLYQCNHLSQFLTICRKTQRPVSYTHLTLPTKRIV